MGRSLCPDRLFLISKKLWTHSYFPEFSADLLTLYINETKKLLNIKSLLLSFALEFHRNGVLSQAV